MSPAEPKQNGILIASKTLLHEIEPSIQGVHRERWIEVYVREYNFELLGVHIPTSNSLLHNKGVYWEKLHQYGKEKLGSRNLVIGDFNTGLEEDAQGAPLHFREKMREFLSMGWTDCWRYTHGVFNQYSWFSNVGNGFRLDHACISPALKSSLMEAYFSHQERMNRISDHSSLIVELDL